MHKIRLRFSKTGTAKYMSHLDLTTTLARAMRRAGVKMYYSEGFNPHPYLSVALPLSVGCGSVCELVDVGTEYGLCPDGLPELINPVMPEGLEVLDAWLPFRKFNDIKWIGLDAMFYYEKGSPHGAAGELTECFSAGIINVTKKSKQKFSTINLALFIQDVAFTGGDVINFTAKVSAQDPSINPRDIISALDNGYYHLAPHYASFVRTEVYDNEMAVFR